MVLVAGCTGFQQWMCWPHLRDWVGSFRNAFAADLPALVLKSRTQHCFGFSRSVQMHNRAAYLHTEWTSNNQNWVSNHMQWAATGIVPSQHKAIPRPKSQTGADPGGGAAGAGHPLFRIGKSGASAPGVTSFCTKTLGNLWGADAYWVIK